MQAHQLASWGGWFAIGAANAFATQEKMGAKWTEYTAPGSKREKMRTRNHLTHVLWAYVRGSPTLVRGLRGLEQLRCLLRHRLHTPNLRERP